MTSDDPGWAPAFARLPKAFLFLQMRGLSTTGSDILTFLRGVILSQSLMVLVFGAIAALLYGNSSARPDAAPWNVAMAAVGAVILGLQLLIVGRTPLSKIPLASEIAEHQIVAVYRTRFFLAVAAAQVPALVSFVATFVVTSTAVTYGIGCAFTIAGLAFAAPTRSSLREDQRRITRAGSPVNLVSSLRHPVE